MLLLLFGPPAVGKMTVGREICARSDFRLFYNHMTIEPLLETFGFGTPAFNTLNAEFRRRIMEEAAAAGLNLVVALVWALELEGDLAAIQSYVDTFGGNAAFVELRAGLATRLERNRTPGRLADKPSKRDLDWSDANVRELEAYQMSTQEDAGLGAALLSEHPHLVIETEGLTPGEVADRVLAWLPLEPVANSAAEQVRHS